jgi:hypothetical protein
MEHVTKIFSFMELDVEKLCKINRSNESVYFKEFIKDKYNKFISEKIYTNKIINYENNKYIQQYDPKHIKKICKDIPLSYLGSKKEIINTILYKINEINKNKCINTIIDLFAGSLCVSYVIKKLYPNINVISCENNKLVINFYESLKDNYGEVIKKIKYIIKELVNSRDKIEYLKNIINEVNETLNSNFSDKIKIASYYYILNKIAFKGIIKYDSYENISMKINKSKIKNLMIFDLKKQNKLYNFSLFLKSIKLKNIDITKNKITNSIRSELLITTF